MIDARTPRHDLSRNYDTRLHDNGDGTFAEVIAAVLVDPVTGNAYGSAPAPDTTPIERMLRIIVLQLGVILSLLVGSIAFALARILS